MSRAASFLLAIAALWAENGIIMAAKPMKGEENSYSTEVRIVHLNLSCDPIYLLPPHDYEIGNPKSALVQPTNHTNQLV